MDLIHKLNITALLILTGITATMLIQHHISVQHQQGTAGNPKIELKKAYEQRIASDTALYAEVVQLLAQKQFAGAGKKLEEIKTAHPGNPHSFIYQAQLQYNQGQIAAAIHSYRLAVNNEPDYVDKNTPLFIGNEIMDIITEARSKLQREKKLKPGDKNIVLALEDIYYLQRRIAGGCE
jgi:predicted Zn-dependent protease